MKGKSNESDVLDLDLSSDWPNSSGFWPIRAIHKRVEGND